MVKKNSTSKFLRDYLKAAPVSHAIWRASEAIELSKYELSRPMLDLGCGFGEFAGVFFDSVVEVGIDTSLKDVLLATKGKKYQRVECVDAREMRFKDESFESVLSVSVLEHIPGVEKVLKEVYRILKPGGAFLFTVPGEQFSRELLGNKLLTGLGFKKAGKVYQKAINRVFKHHNLWTDKRWQKKLNKIGFRVEECQRIVPMKIFRLWELGLPLALPSQIGKMVWGKRWVWRPWGLERWLECILKPMYVGDKYGGTNWLFLARK